MSDQTAKQVNPKTIILGEISNSISKLNSIIEMVEAENVRLNTIVTALAERSSEETLTELGLRLVKNPETPTPQLPEAPKE